MKVACTFLEGESGGNPADLLRYHTGLGFRNELDIDYKRGRPLDDYPKKFELGELSMN